MTAGRDQPERDGGERGRGAGLLAGWTQGRRLHAALLAICLLGFGLRIAHVVEVSDQPLFRHPTVDSDAYDRWALELASGDWLGGKTFYQDPLYPYFLAVIYKGLDAAGTLDRRFEAVAALQALLAALAIWPLFGLGRRVFDDARVGLLAALFWALYKVDFFFTAQLLKTTPGLALTILALWSYHELLGRDRSERPGLAFGSGLISGLLCLFRGNFLAVVPVVLVFLGWDWGRRLGRRAALPVGAFVLGGALVLGATGARNYLVSGEFTLTTAQGGVNFFVGNDRGNDWGAGKDPDFARRTPVFEEDDFLAEARRRTGRDRLSPSEASAFWYREGLREIAADPKLFLLRLVKKTLLVLSFREVSDNLNYYFLRDRFSFLLKLPLPAFWLAGPFGLAGMALALSRRKGALLALFILIYYLTLLAFYVVDRYRLPIVPPLLVFAAYGLLEAPRLIATRDRRGLGLWLGVLAAAALLGLAAWREPAFDLSWQKLGHAYARAGDQEQAIAAYDQALALNPNLGQAWFGKALALDARGRRAEALAGVSRAVELDPRHAQGHLVLGLFLERDGRVEDAVREYRKALELNPDLDQARARLQALAPPEERKK